MSILTRLVDVRRGAGSSAPSPPNEPGSGAFAYQNYRLYWTGQIATNIGSWMQIVATGWLVLQLTDSPAALGLNAAFQGAPVVVLALVGGVVADRIDRLKLLFWAQVVQVIPDLTLAVLVGLGQVRVEYLFVYSFVTACINGLTTPGRQALVAQLVPRKAFLSAMALNSTLWQGAAVVGPAFAGYILAIWGTPGNFYINAGSDFVNLGILLALRLPPVLLAPTTVSGWGHLKEGARYAWTRPRIRALLGSLIVVSLLGRAYTQIMPVFAQDIYHVGPEGLGLLLTMPAVGTIISAVVVTALLPRNIIRWFTISSLLLGIFLALFAWAPSFILALGLLVLVGAASNIAMTVGNTLMQQGVDEEHRGRVMSFFMASTWGGWRLGALPTGVAAEFLGAPAAIGLSGIILGVLALPMLRSRGLRLWMEPTTRTPPPPPADVPEAAPPAATLAFRESTHAARK